MIDRHLFLMLLNLTILGNCKCGILSKDGVKLGKCFMETWNSLLSHIRLASDVNDFKGKLCNCKFLGRFF